MKEGRGVVSRFSCLPRLPSNYPRIFFPNKVYAVNGRSGFVWPRDLIGFHVLLIQYGAC